MRKYEYELTGFGVFTAFTLIVVVIALVVAAFTPNDGRVARHIPPQHECVGSGVGGQCVGTCVRCN